MNTYQTYYNAYLGLKQNDLISNVVSCPQRDIPLNKHYYYSIIATEIKGQLIFSVTPSMYDLFKAFYEKNYELSVENLLISFNQSYDLKHELREMYRMAYEGQPLLISDAVVVTEALYRKVLSKETESILIETLERNHMAIQRGSKFIVIKDGGFAAQATVTDIDHGGGNIAVYTSPDHRKKGYGKMVVDACVQWCFEHEILPVYLVVCDNEPSIKLAKSLRFKTFSKEWVLSIESGLI